MKNLVFFLFFTSFCYSQSNLQNLLKSSEIIVSGLSILKSGKTTKTDTKTIESICMKNKMSDKITFKMISKDEEGK